jgi:hypothetical protein
MPLLIWYNNGSFDSIGGILNKNTKTRYFFVFLKSGEWTEFQS